ncbi:MAG: hypothetical protein D4R90_01640 [Nitrosopumilales archaeon]|nr:MAG: hypothetical protein D4R90_01640 [Nitrosopumilales archaeon]
MQNHLELLYNFSTKYGHDNKDNKKTRRKTLMTDSATITKCLDYAVQIMQWVEGKEHLLAMGKVFLCTLFLGAP